LADQTVFKRKAFKVSNSKLLHGESDALSNAVKVKQIGAELVERHASSFWLFSALLFFPIKNGRFQPAPGAGNFAKRPCRWAPARRRHLTPPAGTAN
jgi:hypothetical protein